MDTLTEKELVDLTGYTHANKQCQWLQLNEIPYLMNGAGRVIVLRAAVIRAASQVRRDVNKARTATRSPTPEEIKAARRKAGLSQSQASLLCGYAPTAWRRYEGGHRPMSAQMFALFRQRAQSLIREEKPMKTEKKDDLLANLLARRKRKKTPD